MIRPSESYDHLFRIENPNIHNEPNGIIWNEDVRGQWFFDDVRHTRGYIRQVTIDRLGTREVVDGARLVIAHVSSEEIENYRASKHAIASTMQYNVCDFIIPRDGSVPTSTLGIDWMIDRLRYKPNRKNIDKAQRRIEILSKLA